MRKFGYLLLVSFMTATLTGCTVKISITPKDRDIIVTDEEILERIEKARKLDPWGETQSLSVASEWAGLDFVPPAEKIDLDNGQSLCLTTYRYMTGTAEALYATDEGTLTFRQSDDTKGAELAEDHSTYTREWSEAVGGLSVRCFGDGQTINLAYYDRSGDHFSISFNKGEEGRGLTVDDLAGIMLES